MLGVVIYGIIFSLYPLVHHIALKYAFLCLAFGDGLAPFANIHKKPGKTWEGSFICFIASLTALILNGCQHKNAVIYAFVCSAVELIGGDWDNLLIFVSVTGIAFLIE